MKDWSESTTAGTMAKLDGSRSAGWMQRCIALFMHGALAILSASSAPRKRAGMKRKSTIVKYSLSEVQDLRKRGKDPVRPSAPEAASLGEEFWKSARVVMPRGRTSVH